MKQMLRSLLLLVLFSFGALTSAHAQRHTVYAALYKENNLAIIDPAKGRTDLEHRILPVTQQPGPFQTENQTRIEGGDREKIAGLGGIDLKFG